MQNQKKNFIVCLTIGGFIWKSCQAAQKYWRLKYRFNKKDKRLAAVFIPVWRAGQQWATDVVVTDHRFLFKHGIIFVRTLELKLENICQVDVNQSWLGNLLGYGSVHMFTKSLENKGRDEDEHLGVQEIFLPAIANPHRFSVLMDIAGK